MSNAVDFVCLSGTLLTVPLLPYYKYNNIITVTKGRIYVYSIYNYLSNLEGGSNESFSPVVIAKILYSKISEIPLSGEVTGYYGGCLITNGETSGKYTYQLDSILVLKDGSWIGRKGANLYGRDPLSNLIFSCKFFKTSILVYLSQDEEVFHCGSNVLPPDEELEIVIEITKYEVESYKISNPSLLSSAEIDEITSKNINMKLVVYYDKSGKYTRQVELAHLNVYRTMILDILKK